MKKWIEDKEREDVRVIFLLFQTFFNDASELDWSIFYWIGRDSTVSYILVCLVVCKLDDKIKNNKMVQINKLLCCVCL